MKITDIAKLANTSVATVSRVINGDPHVSASTKRKVLKVIEQTGYKPNVMGRNLRRSRSGNILAILPTIINQFFSQIIYGLEKRAGDNGYDVLIVVTHRDKETEKKYLELLLTKQVDGAITFTSSLNDEDLNGADLQPITEKYPLVLAAGNTKSKNLSYTCIDNNLAAYDMTKYLIKLGHTKIATIQGNFLRTYEQERSNGFERALTEAALPVINEYRIGCEYDFTGGYNATKKLLALPDLPTAIFAFSDTMAAGSMKCAMEQGLKIGRDIDVVGFDNIELGEMLTPTLTTVSQPQQELGATAFDLLLEKMNDIRSICKGIILPHQLIIRESTRKLK